MTPEERAAVRAVSRLARVLECALGGLTLAQFRVLAAVEEGGERATHLARGLALAKPTVTAAVDGLVERGLLVREPVPGDRRSLRITLTPAGRIALIDAETAMARRLAAVLADSGQGPEAVAALAAVLAVLEGAASR